MTTDELKVGDQVGIIGSAGGSGRPRMFFMGVVEKKTKSGQVTIIADNKSILRFTQRGREVGGDKWHARLLCKADNDFIEKVKKEQLAHLQHRLLSHIENQCRQLKQQDNLLPDKVIKLLSSLKEEWK